MTLNINQENENLITYLHRNFNEFKALEVGSKICLIGSWVAGAGAILLIGSCAVTVECWLSGSEPTPMIKKALATGLGIVVGGAIFTIGAAMEDDRQSDLAAENLYKRIEERRAQKETSPCPTCKFFTNDCDLYCAVNPIIACTPQAQNCKDFELKQ